RFYIERSYGRFITNPRAWLYQVLRHYLMNYLSAAEAQREVGADDLERVPDARQNPEGRIGMKQLVQELADGLTNRELECLSLRAEGFTYAEIAEAMGVRTGTVGALLARVRDRLVRPGNPRRASLGRSRGTLYFLVSEDSAYPT